MIVKALVLGLLTVTGYQPKPAQTKPECINRYHCTTSINDNVTMYGVAVSQDLLRSGAVHYGDVLYIEGYGFRVVNDCMGETKCVTWADHVCMQRTPIVNSIDLLVFTHAEEKAIGVRHKKVLLMSEPKYLPGVPQ